MIEIPRPTARFKQMFVGANGVWRAYYYVNGHQQRVSLRTRDEKIAEARRDLLHTELIGRGARWREKQSVEKKVLRREDLYIRERDPFVVSYKRKTVGSAITLEEARKIRDRFLKTLTENKPCRKDSKKTSS